jgi:uncharacterized protein (DUF2062 family)
MRPFRLVLEHPVYWTLNRRHVARAFALGIFIGFIPVPIHLFLGAALALVLRVNVPAAVAGTLITNPLTAAPLYLSAYWVGCRILDVHPEPIAFEFTWEWLTTTLAPTWKPLLLGCFVLGTLTSLAGYLLLSGVWRLTLVFKYHARKAAGAPKDSASDEK